MVDLTRLTDDELCDLTDETLKWDQPLRRAGLQRIRDEFIRREPLREAERMAVWEKEAADAGDDTFVSLPGDEPLTAAQRAKLRWFFDIREPKE